MTPPCRALGFVAACLSVAPTSALSLQAQPAETVAEIRVHGNHTTPDAVVLGLAGIQPGQPFTEALLADIQGRLDRSGRFRAVDVRKRYASIADLTRIIVVIVVEEQAGVSVDVPQPGPLRKFGASTMWLPVLDYEDGYGFTYGARFSFVDLVGKGSRLSVPLTWGGERRASVEFERTFQRGPFTRVAASGGVWRRENPAYEVGDLREGVTARLERAFAPWLRVGGHAAAADVAFGDLDDRTTAAGVEIVADTRLDPAFPRNALYASFDWQRQWFDTSADTFRTRTDVRGYLGLVGQTVLVVRAQHDWAADALPPFERALLGGTASLRGFELGFRDGDRLAAGSAELRLPISSPLSVGRAGFAVFADAGTTWSADESFDWATFDRGYGGGFFLSALMLSARIDVAHGANSGTRAHFTLGVSF